MSTGAIDRPPNVGYFLNYSDVIPDDYSYRTWWVGPRPDGGGHHWWHALPLLGLRGGDEAALRQAIADESGQAMRRRVRDLSDQLLASAEEDMADGPTVIVSSFVNLNFLYSTSSLGRFLGEQMISELRSAGVKVVDVRKTPTILIRERHGEYGLSRDLDELQFAHRAEFTVVGTYTLAAGQVFLNARLLRNSDALVSASASAVFGMDRLTRDLLADEGLFVAEQEKTVTVKSYQEY